jgi:hypothetical protein
LSEDLRLEALEDRPGALTDRKPTSLLGEQALELPNKRVVATELELGLKTSLQRLKA